MQWGPHVTYGIDGNEEEEEEVDTPRMAS